MAIKCIGAIIGADEGLNHQIAECSGRITLHSPPGGGTTIEITPPLTDPSGPGLPGAGAGASVLTAARGGIQLPAVAGPEA